MRWSAMVVSLVGLVWLPATATHAGDCLAVRDNNIEKERTEHGITIAQWSAQIENACDESYDGTLTVQFLDDQGEVLHEALEVVIIESRGSMDTQRRINIPSDRYNKITRIKIDIRERKRPT